MDKWLTEESLNCSVSQSFKIKKNLFHTRSHYQDIKVVETQALGKVLLLDDMAMISDKDEFIYHEVMSHIPMLVQDKTNSVLVIGAGDGGVIRELVKYSSIEQITMVEIDKVVTETSKIFFPHVASGLTDKRVTIKFENALRFVDQALSEGIKFDLIISDSTDPVGLAEDLYKKTFFEKINSLLSDDGIFMCQTESPFYDEYDIKDIYQRLHSNFKIVTPICAPILIYPGVFWTFGFCSKQKHVLDLCSTKVKEYSEFCQTLKWHNLNWHKTLTQLPNFIEEKIYSKSSVL